MSESPALRRAADGVRVLDPKVGPDTMAVLGAMMSRTPDLAVKFERLLKEIAAEEGVAEWDYARPPRRIVDFLESNVQGYGHASVASMAKSVFLALDGFGWPSAWLLTDSMLFDGQEVSTRAVDATRIPGVDGPGTICRYAPRSLASLHAKWLEVYARVKSEAGSGGWRYDDARVYLPGSTPTGVVLTNDVRALARQADQIAAFGAPFDQLAGQLYAGLEALAPVTTRAIGNKRRRAPGHWAVQTVTLPPGAGSTNPDAFVSITPWDVMPDERRWDELLDTIPPRERASTYLDQLWREAPRFRVSFGCSLGVARDWHRHRPVMPWRLRVVSDQRTGGIALAPWYAMQERIPGKLLRETSAAFFRLLGGAAGEEATGGGLRSASAARWQALHALPFGTLVVVEAVATLPDLVYMLELRYTTKGAHAEYRAQARRALTQLCELLPRRVVDAEHLDGVLETAPALHPI